MNLDELLVEYEPEIAFPKPLDRDLKITELKKYTTGKDFLALGGRITSETTLQRANKIVKEYDAICFRFVEQIVRKNMTVKRTMLGSLEVLADSDAATREAGAGQVYWATDPTGDNEETQAVFDELDEREQSMVACMAAKHSHTSGTLLLKGDPRR